MRPHRPPALPVEAELEEFVAARDSSGEAVLAGGVGERRRSIDDVGRVEVHVALRVHPAPQRELRRLDRGLRARRRGRLFAGRMADCFGGGVLL